MRVELRIAYLFLSLLQARVGASIVSRLGDLDPTDVLALPAGEIAARARLTEKGRRAFEELKESFDPAAVLARLEEKGIWMVTFADEGYPSALAEIPDPLSAALTSNAPLVDNAYKEIQKLLTILKTDVASATGVQITFMDNDGD